MPKLLLKDIGKIYVSEGNVAVGIRGVNLSFDKGEFVAVTGKSGSGKSTLLNVISGMDSYEEGEMYIDGEPTSHYMQSDWESYREKYISFIFQDYNIIESFTVLENVELALLHIEDKNARRKRALELLDRVGLSSHIKQKGSKLSGGQKQRTVIARALAKDSPIILADEPTGNLDSKTSEEIIELLKEVSKDKLLIIVTHNFEEVEKYATRHIRVFDGTVESDFNTSNINTLESTEVCKAKKEKSTSFCKKIENGFLLGKSLFLSKPKLSVFLCLLMIIGALGIFLVTTLSGDAANVFKPSYMFSHIDGRVVLTTENGSVLTEDEVKKIAEEYGALDYLRFDALLDLGYQNSVRVPLSDTFGDFEFIQALFTYKEHFGDDIIGRYPEKSNEVLLYLPISYKPIFGEDNLEKDKVTLNDMNLCVTGVKYFYDNNLSAKCLFTEDGFKIATAVHYMITNSSTSISLSVTSGDGSIEGQIPFYTIIPSFEIEDNKIFIESSYYDTIMQNAADSGTEVDQNLNITAVYYMYDYYNGYTDQMVFKKGFTDESFTDVKPEIKLDDFFYGDRYSDKIIISDELLYSIANEVLDKSYTQVSLFFENDKAAHKASEKLQDAGYIAVPSDTTYELDAETTILNMLESIILIVFWAISIMFLAFFINLCSSRTLDAFKGEVAIMRSMGIQVTTIKIGMYLRMLLALIPAVFLVILLAVLIFTSPKFNGFFVYLYAWQYALIFIGMILLTVIATHKQISKLFGESVKKSLRGGARG